MATLKSRVPLEEDKGNSGEEPFLVSDTELNFMFYQPRRPNTAALLPVMSQDIPSPSYSMPPKAVRLALHNTPLVWCCWQSASQELSPPVWRRGLAVFLKEAYEPDCVLSTFHLGQPCAFHVPRMSVQCIRFTAAALADQCMEDARAMQHDPIPKRLVLVVGLSELSTYRLWPRLRDYILPTYGLRSLVQVRICIVQDTFSELAPFSPAFLIPRLLLPRHESLVVLRLFQPTPPPSMHERTFLPAATLQLAWWKGTFAYELPWVFERQAYGLGDALYYMLQGPASGFLDKALGKHDLGPALHIEAITKLNRVLVSGSQPSSRQLKEFEEIQ